MKHKRRSVAASRAASLKGWRTRKRIMLNRLTRIEELYNQIEEIERQWPTIDRIPKVEWK